RYGVTPDLTCLGKIIGGGLPVGAYGGRREIMLHVAPAGKVYQAGTLSGNPLAMQAGAATLRALKSQPDAYAQLDAKGAFLASALRELAGKYALPVTVNQLGSMFTIFFTNTSVVDYATAKTSHLDAFKSFF